MAKARAKPKSRRTTTARQAKHTAHPVPYPGAPHRGQSNLAIEAIGRALCRAGRRAKRHKYAINVYVFGRYPKRVRRTWGERKIRWLKQFQRHHNLPADGGYDKHTHELLAPFFYSYERRLLTQFEKAKEPSPKQKRWLKLLDAMKDLNAHTAGYVYGSGHSESLDSLSSSHVYDCSSSTCKVLHEAGMFPSRYAWVSGDMAARYGEPGKGKYFTVWANSGHVWIQLHKSPWWRFDTSPWGWRDGDNRSGPRLRRMPRPTWGFTPRHYPGM